MTNSPDVWEDVFYYFVIYNVKEFNNYNNHSFSDCKTIVDIDSIRKIRQNFSHARNGKSDVVTRASSFDALVAEHLQRHLRATKFTKSYCGHCINPGQMG